SCGLLPRATCPGPRVRTAFTSLLSTARVRAERRVTLAPSAPKWRHQELSRASALRDREVLETLSPGAESVPEAAAKRRRVESHEIKAVRRRGPGQVALGSKPQLATTKQLVSWATRFRLPNNS